ncbi:NUDIX domain-containing protein [Patescibacteria group bacterium]|nr:NUDIX domain-containing protein [Patescibacteria group bacterium]
MKIRLVTRVITYDQGSKKVLLVKTRDQDFWYPPGGEWDYDKEDVVTCAEREVAEETGLEVKVIRLLYVQEFHEAPDSISFETIWLAKPTRETELNELHIDRDVDGKVEAAKWFSRGELENAKVFPKRLQNTFWENIDRFLQDENPFIGVS